MDDENVRAETTVLDTVLSKLDYTPLNDVLIKPLPTIQVEKEITTQVPIQEYEKEDITGAVAQKYETKTETKTVDANFQEGVVLAIPSQYIEQSGIKVGDTVVFPPKKGIYFDLFKDSMLIRVYDIVAVKKV